MKVFMIGGTGLLGSEAAKVLISRGHEVTALALPPLPEGAVLPPEMKIEYGNYLEMSDDELRKLLSGHLCRCTGYENILRAVKKTMYRRLGLPLPE